MTRPTDARPTPAPLPLTLEIVRPESAPGFMAVVVIRDAAGAVVCGEIALREDEGRRFVRAVNHHDALVAALQRIDDWSRAYPVSVFPDPDWGKVRSALETAGITLDSVSAANMRHVVEGVGDIARAVLAAVTDQK